MAKTKKKGQVGQIYITCENGSYLKHMAFIKYSLAGIGGK
jgi:hypothetical protein